MPTRSISYPSICALVEIEGPTWAPSPPAKPLSTFPFALLWDVERDLSTARGCYICVRYWVKGFWDKQKPLESRGESGVIFRIGWVKPRITVGKTPNYGG